MELKFDSFYYSEDRQVHFLPEILSVSDDELNKKYKGKMYCPLCKMVQLSLSHGVKTTFLRTYPKQNHGFVSGSLCLYSYKEASSRTVNIYIDELRDKKKIKSLLNSTLRYLLNDKMKLVAINNQENVTFNPLIIEPAKKIKNKERTVIPHYSFKSWGVSVPDDRLVIIYGEVKIVVKESETGDYAYLHFKTIDSDKFITSCLKPKDVEITDGLYYVALLGKRHENKGFQNVVLNKPESESIITLAFS